MSSHLLKMVPLIFIFFNSSLVFGGVHFRKIGKTTLGRSIAIQRPMKNLPACMLNCERTADCEFVGAESDLCELLGAGDTKLTYMQVYQKIPVGQSSPTFVQTTKTTLTQITTTQGTTTTTKTPTTTKASTLSKETPTDLPSTEAPTITTTTATPQETRTTATEVTTRTTEPPTTTATSITTEATTATTTTTESKTTTKEATTITNVPTTTTKLPTKTKASTVTIKVATKTTEAIVTTTEQTTVSYNCPVYYTGSDCSTVKDISVILNEWCQNTHAGTLARYDAVQNNVTYDWACYSPSALTHDAHFWQEGAQGGVYFRGASELYDLVNNHPLKCDFNETDCFSLCDINETCSHLSCTGMFTTFKCRRGVIRMLDFFFGRTRLDVCPYKQMVVSCVNFTTQQETNARRMCDDDPSCILQASFDFKDKCPQNWTREPWEGIWGDPCPDHSKYLNLTYTCIDKEPWNFFQTPWSNWSECSATCGIGTASRTRTCTEQPGKECTVSSCAFKLKDDPGLFYQATPCWANVTCPTPSFTTSYKRHHRSTSHYVIAPTSSRVTRSSAIPTAPTLPEKPNFYANVTLTMIWHKFCEAEAQFRNGVSKMLERRIQERVSADQVVILNKEKCAEHANQGDKANVKFVITVKSSNEPSEPLTKVAVEELLKLINNGRTTDVGGDFKNGTITDIVLVVHKTPQERVLPVWIIVLITIAAICLLIWIVFLCRYCCCRQRCVGGEKKSFIISNGPFTYAYKNKKSLTAEPLFRSSMRVKLSLNEVDNPNYEIQEVEGKDGKIRYSLSPVPEKIDEEKPPQVDNNPRQSITKVFMDGKVISEIPTAALGQEAIKISLASNIAIEEEQDSQL